MHVRASLDSKPRLLLNFFAQFSSWNWTQTLKGNDLKSYSKWKSTFASVVLLGTHRLYFIFFDYVLLFLLLMLFFHAVDVTSPLYLLKFFEGFAITVQRYLTFFPTHSLSLSRALSFSIALVHFLPILSNGNPF